MSGSCRTSSSRRSPQRHPRSPVIRRSWVSAAQQHLAAVVIGFTALCGVDLQRTLAHGNRVCIVTISTAHEQEVLPSRTPESSRGIRHQQILPGSSAKFLHAVYVVGVVMGQDQRVQLMASHAPAGLQQCLAL